jgi:putative FmdB family regulatory protein
MPIYEYACPRCGHLFEKFQSIHAAAVANCEQCGRSVKRIISRSSFILRGTGWYATDYKKDAPAKRPGPQLKRN